jgi:hypothetical protein
VDGWLLFRLRGRCGDGGNSPGAGHQQNGQNQDWGKSETGRSKKWGHAKSNFTYPKRRCVDVYFITFCPGTMRWRDDFYPPMGWLLRRGCATWVGF